MSTTLGEFYSHYTRVFMLAAQLKSLKKEHANLFFSIKQVRDKFVTIKIGGGKFVAELKEHSMYILTTSDSTKSIFHEIIHKSLINTKDNFLIYLPENLIKVNIDTVNNTKLITFSYLVFNVSEALGG